MAGELRETNTMTLPEGVRNRTPPNQKAESEFESLKFGDNTLLPLGNTKSQELTTHHRQRFTLKLNLFASFVTGDFKGHIPGKV